MKKYRYISMIGGYWNIHAIREEAIEYGLKKAESFMVVHQVYEPKRRRYKTTDIELVERQLKMQF